MRKIIVAEFLSLDGIMEAPENWTFPYYTDEVGNVISNSSMRCDCMLLGRVTYQGFEASFSSQSGGIADVMNNQTKYVVSTTLKRPTWKNSQLIKGDAMKEIAALKQQPGKDILVTGSSTLIQALMHHDLVDEYSLLVYPVVLRTGKRLFQNGQDGKNGHNPALNLIDAKPFSSGVVHLTYRSARKE